MLEYVGGLKYNPYPSWSKIASEAGKVLDRRLRSELFQFNSPFTVTHFRKAENGDVAFFPKASKAACPRNEKNIHIVPEGLSSLMKI